MHIINFNLVLYRMHSQSLCYASPSGYTSPSISDSWWQKGHLRATAKAQMSMRMFFTYINKYIYIYVKNLCAKSLSLRQKNPKHLGSLYWSWCNSCCTTSFIYLNKRTPTGQIKLFPELPPIIRPSDTRQPTVKGLPSIFYSLLGLVLTVTWINPVYRVTWWSQSLQHTGTME